MSDYNQRFGGIGRLYGPKGIQQLAKSHVAVIGIGGVGSWTVEALARSGIGELTLIDLDDICVTNTNRQIHTTSQSFGKLKVETMRDRVLAIHPGCRVHAVPEFFNSKNAERLLESGFHCVVDAIDQVANKCALIAHCHRLDLSIVSTGAAGGRTNPSSIRIADLSKVTHDPLIKRVRKQLRNVHGFPDGNHSAYGVPCIYSTEPPVHPADTGSECALPGMETGPMRMDCNDGYGSATFVTGTFGFFAAGEAIRLLVYPPPESETSSA